jgi:D-3-phosphoglycerate dehydrogenase / 2-oxoglutarate reductase
MSDRVLITCPPMLGMMEEFTPEFSARGYEVYCPQVTQTLSESELIELVPQFAGWIIGDDPATYRVFEAGKRGKLRAAVKWGVGVDNVDFSAAKTLGIPVSNTPRMFGGEVADLAFAYLVALARDFISIDRGVREGAWPKPRGISLAGRTLGLAGLGDIGRNLARRASAADMKVIAYDPGVSSAPSDLAVVMSRWPERIGECDFLAFTCALTAESRHMLNERTIERIRRGVRIVNVARGPLIDERALEKGLRSGMVHAAALDVFETEPLPANSGLRSLERCIFGSHNGSNTIDGVRRASKEALRLLFGFLESRKP